MKWNWKKERHNIEQQNRRAYQLLLASADSLFLEKQYTTAKTKYQTAQNLQPDDSYPGNRIREIDRLLAQLAQQNAEQQKQIAETEAKYKKILLSADQAMTAKNYEKAIETYQQALALKTTETYPRQKNYRSGTSPGTPPQTTGRRSRATTGGTGKIRKAES